MTTTDVAGLPAEIRAVLARERVSQDGACESSGLPRSTYYRRDAMPGTWRLGELSRLLAAAGADVRVSFGTLDLDQDVAGADTWRLGELASLARGLGVELRLELDRRDA